MGLQAEAAADRGDRDADALAREPEQLRRDRCEHVRDLARGPDPDPLAVGSGQDAARLDRRRAVAGVAECPLEHDRRARERLIDVARLHRVVEQHVGGRPVQDRARVGIERIGRHRERAQRELDRARRVLSQIRRVRDDDGDRFADEPHRGGREQRARRRVGERVLDRRVQRRQLDVLGRERAGHAR